MEFISGNIFVRPMQGDGFSPGDVMSGHTHNFDHTSIFFTGRWRVRRWLAAVNEAGEELTMPSGEKAWLQVDDFEREAPFHLLIEANCRHEFTFIGFSLPDWMEKYIKQLTPEAAEAFTTDYKKSLGKAWCVYSHRTPQGDVSETQTGWQKGYA